MQSVDDLVGLARVGEAIDGDGKIVSRSVGYSTKLGIQARAWMNKN